MHGPLSKMRARLGADTEYALVLGDAETPLNPRLGQVLTLRWTGRIFCDACGRETKKSFAQGHCYPCMQKLARCDLCVVKPETCHFAAGTCREPDWGERHCMIPHVVYLANTSGLKVGITRESQLPTRWLDQGATQALPVLGTATRHLAGLVEVALARSHADKTNWRAMLKGGGAPLDLAAAASAALAGIADDLTAIRATHGADAVWPLDNAPLDITYPVTRYPQKIASHNFDKTAAVSGVLEGIKGQYLLFDNGVINLRKFTGYEVELVDTAA
ncbi:MAG: DUF2797 domain-containing protein [Gammaproteobacteria bacterium]|nr:DUF2797 domain-containing protein [Gammaproteobacteria bacterium]